MVDIGNIKPPGPVWPQPVIDKVKRKEDQTEQQRRQDQHTPADEGKGDDESGGIDEYV